MFKNIFTTSACIVFLAVQAVYSQADKYDYSEEKNIYQQVANVDISTTEGQQIRLSEMYSRTPLIMALIFTRCTGVCSPLLLNLSENIQLLQSDRNFRVLVLSFDPEDELEDMDGMAHRFSLENNEQWIFATTSRIDDLISSVAFEPTWDESRKQFDHEALLVGINKDGFITKRLTGMRDHKALAGMLRTIDNEFSVSYPLPRKNMLFSCFTYDPTTGKNKPSWGLLILIFPAVATGALLFLLTNRFQKS